MSDSIVAVVFTIGEARFALPVERIHGIERTLPVTRLPYYPEYLKGVVNLHGTVLPVVSLTEMFTRTEQRVTDESRLIIVTADGRKAALLADGAQDVASLERSTMIDAVENMGGIPSHFIQGVAQDSSGVSVGLLDLDKVLKEEMESLGKL